MAEFLNQRREPDYDGDGGYNLMGKPVTFTRRAYAETHCKEMGLNTEHSYSVINGMSLSIEKDNIYEALECAMRYLDLTGAYRLLAALLTPEVKEQTP